MQSAFVCGVSYGGLVALRYTADSDRGACEAWLWRPRWRRDFEPDARAQFYMRAPRLLMPLFFVDGFRRARREVHAALPEWRQRMQFGLRQTWYVATALPAPRLMRDRLRLLEDVDFDSSAASVTAPTLVITGDAELDHVVPVRDTLRYERLLPAVEVVQMRGTGHHGTLTRPEDFARHLGAFAARVIGEVKHGPGGGLG